MVRVDARGEVVLAKAYGLAHRGWGIANTVDTRFGIASGGKGLTALAVVSLIEEGRLELATAARSVLGRDLPLIRDDVTVEHLLSHTSGIGDYLDEEESEVEDYVMPVPVHRLDTTEHFVPVLEGHRSSFAAGERFSYCNGGYVVLALIAERATGVPFPALVRERVCAPAGMGDTDFLRIDEPPGRVAVGYLGTDGLRTNVLHLPVLATGDGGAFTTAADVASLWAAFLGGAIVTERWVDEVLRPRSQVADGAPRYGLGFWLHPTSGVMSLHGLDPGQSFRSVHDPTSGVTHTVLSNWTDGAWPLTHHLDTALGS